jgi:hypothetical protein
VSVDFMAQWPVPGEQWPEIGESVNCNNGRAAEILDLLGYDSSWPIAGEDSPGEFTARVRRALMRAGNVAGADGGTPWTEDGGPGTGRARWVECGRRPGYFAERLPELEAVAAEAERHGGMVVWA